MRLMFFQRLLDQLQSRVAIINDQGAVLLVSERAKRQFALAPGARVEVLHREGDRVLIHQPATQQLHSALSIRWLKLDFLLFQGPEPEALPGEQPALPRASNHDRALIEFCSSAALQSRLAPHELQQLQRLLANDDAGESRHAGLGVAADIDGRVLNPLALMKRAFGPRLGGVDEFFLQAPSTLGALHGDEALLASALRSLAIDLVHQQHNSRLLARLHQDGAQLLITVQDIGLLQLPRMIRLDTDAVWDGAAMDSPASCSVIERHGGQLRVRGDMPQGRITISLPLAIKGVFN